MDLDKIIVCPGCGWTGGKNDLLKMSGLGMCPDCGYENGLEPYRLLTLKEILDFPIEGHFNQVDLHAFLNAVKPYLEGTK